MIRLRLIIYKLFAAFDLSESFWFKYFIKGSDNKPINDPDAVDDGSACKVAYSFETTAGKLPGICAVVVYEYIKSAGRNEPFADGGVDDATINVLNARATITLLPLPAGMVFMKNIFNNICVEQFKENNL